MSVIGSLIGAGSSLLGGLLGKKSTDDANKRNIQLQKDFAQQGIQWKVDDARKAGIHPLYALGANTVSFSPSVVGDTALPTALADAGQNIGRAIDSTRTFGGRAAAFDKTVQDLQLTRMGLENELLASQIAAVRAPGTPPPMPAMGDNEILKLGGVDVAPHPGWSDAQKFENRYGEWTDWTVGPLIGAADAFKKLKDTVGSNPGPATGNFWSDFYYGRK